VLGGGVVLHEAMYDLADELGILLMQEFPLANIPVAQFPTSPEYLAMLEATARNIVRQVRNHPSIMEFSGGNEIRWTSASIIPVIDLLRRVVEEEDGRLFRAPPAPTRGATHGAGLRSLAWQNRVLLDDDLNVGGPRRQADPGVEYAGRGVRQRLR